ncbi:putative Mg2+ transporter-C (MgtC) family protein [Paenibacillus sp. yr247]|uniref:MgtC/SapB family protein n=1 Tax=Paenibacillus sp. yr247 TaxID=1761880 RepID=UPI00087EDE17|nr:MgtC/SapB family protein [Paenibacillus sp. yr247]SDO40208.1 putative Mg2+ transporter-C (MgtC) family protein [Paenibacillus sp. yr247]
MNSVWHISNVEYSLRILLALLCGGLIGFEREWSRHAAGFRTHILVCLGSAALMLLSIYGFSQFVAEANVRLDPTRLAAQVISGIGFLGAGAIMRNGNVITGLTTAASIWIVAAIGLCLGAGFYYVASLSTALVLISLFVFSKWERKLLHRRSHHEVVIHVVYNSGIIEDIMNIFQEQKVQVVGMEMKEASHSIGEQGMELRFRLKSSSLEQIIKAIARIGVRGEVVTMDAGKLEVYSIIGARTAAAKR